MCEDVSVLARLYYSVCSLQHEECRHLVVYTIDTSQLKEQQSHGFHYVRNWYEKSVLDGNLADMADTPVESEENCCLWRGKYCTAKALS